VPGKFCTGVLAPAPCLLVCRTCNAILTLRSAVLATRSHRTQT